MNDSSKKVDMRYIYLSKEHNELLTKMMERGSLAKKEDGIKLGVAIALFFDPLKELSQADHGKLTRSIKGVLNLNSADIDEDQEITGAMSILTGDFTKNNYRRMMELSYIGLNILSEKYINNEKLIDWEKLQGDMK